MKGCIFEAKLEGQESRLFTILLILTWEISSKKEVNRKRCGGFGGFSTREGGIHLPWGRESLPGESRVGGKYTD